jgi:hypothetical protein
MNVRTTLPMPGGPGKPRRESGALLIRLGADANEIVSLRPVSDWALDEIEKVIERDWQSVRRRR